MMPSLSYYLRQLNQKMIDETTMVKFSQVWQSNSLILNELFQLSTWCFPLQHDYLSIASVSYLLYCYFSTHFYLQYYPLLLHLDSRQFHYTFAQAFSTTNLNISLIPSISAEVYPLVYWYINVQRWY